MKPYKSYLFRDKDPAIDELRNLFEKHNLRGDRLTRKSLKEIETGGGPIVGTTSNWFFGSVKRPHSASLEAAGRAIGFKRVWRKMEKG
jgi:hypothetical protein